MFQHNRRAKDVAEGVDSIRGGIRLNVPTERGRCEVRKRAAITRDSDRAGMLAVANDADMDVGV